MNQFELIATLVSAVGVASFAAIFTILYRTYATAAVAEYESGQADVDLIEETILANVRERKAHRRVLRRVKQGLLIALAVLLIPFLLLSLYTKITHGIAMVGGKGLIAVASGSMSEKNSANPYLASINNQFNTYDMIELERVDAASELKLYDVIAYVNDDGVNVIHRIVGFQSGAAGVRYVTRGDSNNADDEYKPTFDDVLGRYTGERVPYVGVFVLFLQSYSGLITVAAVIYCLFMIEVISGRLHRAREARLALLQDSIDFRTETVADETLDSSFVETVYFKNFAYTFDEKGFVSKTVIPPSSETNDLKPDACAQDAQTTGDGEEL